MPRPSPSRVASSWQRRTASAAEDYAAKMTEGPITEQDVIGHRHLLDAIKGFQQAYKELIHQAPTMATSRELEEAFKDGNRLVGVLEIPVSILAEPKKRPRRPRPRRS